MIDDILIKLSMAMIDVVFVAIVTLLISYFCYLMWRACVNIIEIVHGCNETPKKSETLTDKINSWQEKHNCTLYIFNCDIDQVKINDMIRMFDSFPEDRRVDIIIIRADSKSISLVQIMCNMINNHEGEVNIYIPTNISGMATIVALSGENIFMNRNSHLSSINFYQLFWDDSLKNVGLIKTLSVIYNNIIEHKYPDKLIREEFFSGENSHGMSYDINDFKDLDISYTTPCPLEINEIYNIINPDS